MSSKVGAFGILDLRRVEVWQQIDLEQAGTVGISAVRGFEPDGGRAPDAAVLISGESGVSQCEVLRMVWCIFAHKLGVGAWMRAIPASVGKSGKQ